MGGEAGNAGEGVCGGEMDTVAWMRFMVSN